jgi:hypothetical protein
VQSQIMLFEEHDKKEQIPTEYNEEQTLRAVRKQSQTPGERKEKSSVIFQRLQHWDKS